MAEFIERSAQFGLVAEAPVGSDFTAYDAAQQLIYAQLLDAEEGGQDWRDAAHDILLLDVDADPEAAEQCWRSHYDRATWTVSAAGLTAAAASSVWAKGTAAR